MDAPAYLERTEIYNTVHAPEGYALALSYGVVLSGLKEDETHTLVIIRRTPSWSTMDAGITLPETPRR
jgi:hypothetical protein